MKRALPIVLLALCAVVCGTETISSFGDAEKVWKGSKDRAEYQTYAEEFSQFNNHFHLDTKDGCYALGGKPVQLMLVIVRHDGEPYARIEEAYSDVENEKADCFKKTYTGIATKAPPFYPFVLELGMG